MFNILNLVFTISLVLIVLTLVVKIIVKNEVKNTVNHEIKRNYFEQSQYSLNHIYDEDNDLIGHEWNQFVSEGHWVKMIFDEREKKFVYVKHYRTDKNTDSKSRDKRIEEEINFNLNNVFGYSNGSNKKRKKQKHISLSQKISMRNS